MCDDVIHFTNNTDADIETKIKIFKNFFEQHMAAYYILRGMRSAGPIKIATKEEKSVASLTYSVKPFDDCQKKQIFDNITNTKANVKIYGQPIKPKVFMSGDLLCLTIEKEK